MNRICLKIKIKNSPSLEIYYLVLRRISHLQVFTPAGRDFNEQFGCNR